MHLALDVDGHVHAHQPLVGQQVRTLAAESQGRIDLFEKRKHIHVVDLSAAKKQ